MKNQTVVVTGAGGFIGSHLTEKLVEMGAKTRAFVHYNSSNSWGWLDESPLKGDMQVILGDVRDPDSLKRAIKGADVVFHLAALIGIPYSYHAPLSYVRTNIEGTLNVLQLSANYGVKRVVSTSTSEVYGTARYVPIDEKHPLQGQSPYSASKIGADKIAESFYCSFGVPMTILRPFNTFGPRQSTRAVIPTIITQCLTKGEIRLGNLNPTRDLNFVTNTVDGFIKVAEIPASIGQTLNIGSGREISIGDLARLIAKMVGKNVTVIHEEERMRPEKSEVGRLLANASAAREVLSWEPKVSLEEGLKITIEWMTKNLNRYHPDVYVI